MCSENKSQMANVRSNFLEFSSNAQRERETPTHDNDCRWSCIGKTEKKNNHIPNQMQSHVQFVHSSKSNPSGSMHFMDTIMAT